MKKLLIIIYLILQITIIFANPFTGNQDSPTPVHQSQPSQQILKGQRMMSEKLGNYIAEWNESRHVDILLSILSMSFLYGIIHALGPGHRKTVVFSFFLTRKAHVFEPLITGILLALLHAGTAIILMLIFKGAGGAISVKSNNTIIYMEGFTFLVLILLALYGLLDGIHHFLDSDCHEKSTKINWGVIVLSGMYPCPAAMLVMVFAVNLNIMNLGVWSALTMSLGMSVPIIVSGYLAWCGRVGFFYKLKNNKRIIKFFVSGFQILGYGLLLCISLYIAFPFLIGLLS